jgi:hypothetical protein
LNTDQPELSDDLLGHVSGGKPFSPFDPRSTWTNNHYTIEGYYTKDNVTAGFSKIYNMVKGVLFGKK